jgi:copper chaperone CopZ
MAHIVGTLRAGMLRSLLATPLVLAVALAGCAGTTTNSSSKFKGDQAAVAKVMENLETYSQPGRSDPSKVCDQLLTTDLQHKLAARGTSCKDTVNTALRNADAYQLTVQNVAINGTRATAQVKVDTGKKDRVQSVGLEKQAGSWRIYRFQ